MALVAIGSVSFFVYAERNSVYTGTYEGKSYVIGSDLTPAARREKEIEHASNDTLLYDAHGVSTQVGSPEGIHAASRMLRILYLITIVAFAGGMISVLQVVETSRKRPTVAKPGKAKPNGAKSAKGGVE